MLLHAYVRFKTGFRLRRALIYYGSMDNDLVSHSTPPRGTVELLERG